MSGVDRLEPGLESLVKKILNEAGICGKGNSTVSSHVRLLFTSKKSPDEMLAAGYDSDAIKSFTQRVIRVPALRERPQDIALLVRHFLAEACREFDKEISDIEEEALGRLLEYTWPGNIKELKILVEHTVMNTSGRTLTINELLLPATSVVQNGKSIQDSTFKSAREKIETLYSARDRHISGDTFITPDSMRKDTLRKQKTLRGKVVIYGQGLHSGQKTGLTISPLPPSSGINFGHITSGGTVPALLTFVESTDFSTSLRGNESLAKTIKHLMAVFHVYGLTNLLVKISGEVPIMDGSALEFCNLVEKARK